MPRADGNRAVRCGLQYRQGVPDAVEPGRRDTERRQMLFEIYADAAEKYSLAADVGLVGEGGGVQRQERNVVALRHQLGGQRVVAQTTTAIHIRGAGGDGEDLH